MIELVDPRASRMLVLFSILIIVLPLSSLFISKFVLSDFFHMDGSASYIGAAVVSIVVVHIVLLGFIVVAFSETKPKKIQ
uniref:Vacuolar ATPase assembly integral membrane protein VMA21 homolog n=1 Tax=Trichobilharzia regenti TaxID=157069 RepID=A0AA85KAR0_TRIRE|nr:unnamed protein product [Trichobilharzia regenti]